MSMDVATLGTEPVRQPGNSGNGEADETAEHPLAQKLRSVLVNPNAHCLGDLARVVDQIMGEMAMLKATDRTGGEIDL
jgi:hypothetical protein